MWLQRHPCQGGEAGHSCHPCPEWCDLADCMGLGLSLVLRSSLARLLTSLTMRVLRMVHQPIVVVTESRSTPARGFQVSQHQQHQSHRTFLDVWEAFQPGIEGQGCGLRRSMLGARLTHDLCRMASGGRLDCPVLDERVFNGFQESLKCNFEVRCLCVHFALLNPWVSPGLDVDATIFCGCGLSHHASPGMMLPRLP